MPEKKIKLLVLGIKWPPETFIYNLLNGLSKNGICVTIAAPEVSNRHQELQKKDFIMIPLFSDNQPAFMRMTQIPKLLFIKILRYPAYFISFWRATNYLMGRKQRARFFLYKILPLIDKRFDIIHFQWNSEAIQYMPFFELFGAKVVISCRGSQINIAPYNPRRKDITKELLQESFSKADAIHCVSEAIKQEVLKYTAEEGKIRVIKPAVDTGFFYPQLKKGAPPAIRVMSVGSLCWRKGYEYALAAIKNLVVKGFNIDFTIIGEGEMKQQILYTIFDLGIEKYIKLAGYKSQEEIRQMLWDSDIFLLSSLIEGISNALLEAMACALPVIASDCPGLREVINDGKNGILVPVRDPSAISLALERLIKDRQLRINIGLEARVSVAEEFSLDRQVKYFLELYENISS